MNGRNPALESLLNIVRNHPGFPELLNAVETPRIPKFRPSRADNVEEERARWIHQSGRRDQHDRWLLILTGKAPDDGDTHEPGQ